jgi:hypothetical protein
MNLKLLGKCFRKYVSQINKLSIFRKVAIFRKELDGDLGFICGGSLISKSLIVTGGIKQKHSDFPISLNNFYLSSCSLCA